MKSHYQKENRVMQHRLFRLVCLCIIGALLVACAATPGAAPASAPADGEAAAPAGGNTVSAIKVDSVSTDAAAAYWADAPALTVPTVAAIEGEPDGSAVTIQAVYDDNNVAMRFEWADETNSLMKHAWTWDGSAFTQSGDEDRLQLAFAIENNPEFATNGCASACHNTDPDPATWYMASDSEAMRLDFIHWKSARTNPVGQADDQWMGVQTDPTDVESARHGDAKESGGYADNVNEAGDGPASMHASDPAAQVIIAGEEIEIDTSALASGAVVPGYVIAPAVGSRGDISANGVWADGKWVVVIMRALDTGHDDVIFTPPKSYPFGLSITDNGGGTDHSNAPDVLVLEWQ
jgi:hypothetical protein